MNDLGFTISLAPGASIAVSRRGEWFQLNSGGEAAKPAEPWTPKPWEFPDALVAVTVDDEMVAGVTPGALHVDSEELGPVRTGPAGVRIVGSIERERVADAVVGPSAGETLEVHVTGSVLDLDMFWPKIEQAQKDGGRVEFLVGARG